MTRMRRNIKTGQRLTRTLAIILKELETYHEFLSIVLAIINCSSITKREIGFQKRKCDKLEINLYPDIIIRFTQ